MSRQAQIVAMLKTKGWPLTSANLFVVSDEAICRYLFFNYRTDGLTPRGLRLTNSGLTIMRGFFQSWTIVLSEEHTITSKNVLFLDRTCMMPWHLAGRYITLFEAQYAMRLKLVGDLDTFEDAFEF